MCRGVAYSRLVPVLTDAVKALVEESERLRDENAQLRGRLDSLEKAVAQFLEKFPNK